MIVCAALLIEMKATNEQVVIPCFRHGFGYEMLNNLCLKGKYTLIEEGFITHANRFLDREEAYAHAKFCGQLSEANKWYKQDHYECELYSEDLY